MSIPINPQGNKNSHKDIILRSQIEEAQRHTNSNAGAARWLGVPYLRYKKYAKLYGIFDRHLNPDGVGVPKGFAKRPTSIPLRDVLAGKHPKYSLARLKNRLIARKKLADVCALCGFSERRITDNMVPLMLRFVDGDHTNFKLENLELYCYNCMFLTTGAPSVVNRKHVITSFTDPDRIPKKKKLEPSPTDWYDPGDEDTTTIQNVDIQLTDEEIQELLNNE